MSNEIAKLDQVLIQGDLSTLSTEQKLGYYSRVCESLGLNPLTKPFAYIKLNSKEVLYATRDCTDQLRSIQKISMSIVSREVIEGIYVVTAKGRTLDGREDEATGAVSIDKLSGEMKANAFMKAETKAKRRLTLSICGLGFTDESEIESIPGAKIVDVPLAQPQPAKAIEEKQVEVPQKEERQKNIVEEYFDSLPKESKLYERVNATVKWIEENEEISIKQAAFDKLVLIWESKKSFYESKGILQKWDDILATIPGALQEA